jgi:hypothetical protein
MTLRPTRSELLDGGPLSSIASRVGDLARDFFKDLVK